MGYAARGIGEGQEGWTLYNYGFTDIGGTDFVTSRKVALGNWTDRATYSYA